MVRTCCGLTRAGRPCSLTSSSSIKDNKGRSAASPLRRGGDRCLFHAQPFSTHPVTNLSEPLVILLLDLETTGVDATQDRIVEFSAIQALPTSVGASFSTVVHVGAELLSTPRARQAAAVHGIPDCEIAASPSFPECWRRFLAFADALLNELLHRVTDGEESSDEEETPSQPRPSEEQPTLLIAAHNGNGFDFAVLLSECYRHKLDLDIFERWVYVDTLRVFRSVAMGAMPCLKLQCMMERLCHPDDLKAHRARDDCVALLRVLQNFAARLGLTIDSLLRLFAEAIDLGSSVAQVSVLV